MEYLNEKEIIYQHKELEMSENINEKEIKDVDENEHNENVDLNDKEIIDKNKELDISKHIKEIIDENEELVI